MQTDHTNILARDDTLFGVCQALGDDFGFNPFWLRVGFSVALLVNPVAVIAAYFAAGVVVLLSRLISPNPRPAALPAPAEAAPAKALAGDNETQEAELAVAA